MRSMIRGKEEQAVKARHEQEELQVALMQTQSAVSRVTQVTTNYVLYSGPSLDIGSDRP
jgi:hypothetical protein